MLFVTLVAGGKVFMHNEIGLRAGLKHHVDHKDRDGLNNRRSNLRSATHKQNCEKLRATKGQHFRV